MVKKNVDGFQSARCHTASPPNLIDSIRVNVSIGQLGVRLQVQSNAADKSPPSD